MMKLASVLKICVAILMAVIDLSCFSTAYADDPAYYKLTDLEGLTIYKEGDNELRPTFSLETAGFQEVNPGWGKRKSSYGEFGSVKSVFQMETISEIHHRSRSLPQVVSKDRQTGPDNGSCRARVYWDFLFLI
jgi:hypothetical protein